MLSGLGVTLYYMVVNQAWLREQFGVEQAVALWWGVEPISAGIFGVAVGTLVMWVVSRVTPPPSADEMRVAQRVRTPA